MTNRTDLIQRTQEFALRVTRVFTALPKDPVSQVMGKQLLRAGTSVGANYRSACRGKSPKDFIAKMAIVEEEADESAYWMELMIKAGVAPSDNLAPLLREAHELTAIAVASKKTARARLHDRTERNDPTSFDN